MVPRGEADLSSLRFGICGAAPMSAALIRQFEQVTGIRILEGYGLTEGTCISAINPRDGAARRSRPFIAALRYLRCGADVGGLDPSVRTGDRNPYPRRLW